MNEKVKAAIERLTHVAVSILGICNGFRALEIGSSLSARSQPDV